MSRATPESNSNRTWQQTKSQNTRNTILDAAIRCFYRFGYNNTTTEKIANEAGVSRGAMLHHFPSRADLIKAAVLHLNNKRLSCSLGKRTSSRATQRMPHRRRHRHVLGAAEHRLLRRLPRTAGRRAHRPGAPRRPHSGDRTIRSRGIVATREIFPDLAQSHEFTRANALTLFLLEGLAANLHTRRPTKIAEELLMWLKRELRRSFYGRTETRPRVGKKGDAEASESARQRKRLSKT